MYSSLKVRSLAAMVVVAASFAMGPAPAQARLSAEAVTSVTVTGTAGLESNNLNRSFEGNVTITEFSLDGDQLVAEGFISGVATGDDGTSVIVTQTFEADANVTVVGKGGKAVISIDLAQADLDVVGLSVDVAPVEISLASLKGNARNLANLIVKLPGLLASGNTVKIEKQLARINSILGNFYKNVEVDGSATFDTVSGTINGFFTLEELSIENGELVFSGLLNGTVVVDGVTTAVINESISTTGTIDLINNGKTGIVLDLSSFVSSSIPDLEVDLLPVTLDTSSVTGTGKLLVNQIRKLTKYVVDGDILDDKVGKVIGKINSLL